jgi:mRNA interferase HigB
MRVVTRTRLVEFWCLHPAAEGPLSAWETAVKGAVWTRSNDVKQTFRNANWANDVWIFDASRFRILGTVQYQRISQQGRMIPGVVYIKGVMTHSEYDDWSANTR